MIYSERIYNCPICQDDAGEFVYLYKEEWICLACLEKIYEKEVEGQENLISFQDWMNENDVHREPQYALFEPEENEKYRDYR